MICSKRSELVKDRVVSVNRSPQIVILKLTNPHLMINATKKVPLSSSRPPMT